MHTLRYRVWFLSGVHCLAQEHLGRVEPEPKVSLELECLHQRDDLDLWALNGLYSEVGGHIEVGIHSLCLIHAHKMHGQTVS